MKDEYPLDFRSINPNPEERLQQTPTPIILMLDRLQDPRNLGSLFRLADACRLVGIYGFRCTVDPKASRTQRAARHTLQYIPYQPLQELSQVEALTQQYRPIALEYTNRSVPYYAYQQKDPCMLIIGNEQRGVSGDLLEMSVQSLHIPMLGMNSSMNVAVASGIVLYHFLNCLDLRP